MANRSDVRLILEEALEQEKGAEKKCDKILELLEKNGFTEIVEHVRNDEIKHQEIVKELIKMIK